jgi:hypothetical protein
MQAQKSRAKGAENKYKLSDNLDITETKENSGKLRKSKKMRPEETEKNCYTSSHANMYHFQHFHLL